MRLITASVISAKAGIYSLLNNRKQLGFGEWIPQLPSRLRFPRKRALRAE
jgi:hypothetical protein